MQIRADSESFARLQTLIRKMANAGQDLAPFMRVAGAIMQDSVEEAFATETAPGGRAWQPLAASTANAFVTRARGGSAPRRGYHPILQVTGRLAASFEPRITRMSAAVGSNLVYARVQMLGGGPSGIPARPAIGFSPEALGELEARATDWQRDWLRQVKGWG